ncbi:N-acetylmuramoyl-L-alanine amidase [Intestinibacter bartlettii]|uniref:N-acetylmuramoyl-L-alanine amidase n=1 Tax=Intestinibacter bartlettii TaxID=261299 RepID=UPI00242DBD33|nr:N-acetylmuramoyl-L-alanine amidase [Intestinibacter bartlettii]
MEIKKIAVRGGHTELCTGASALIDELTEDRKVTAAVIKYLRELGNEVLDVTPPVNYTSDEYEDLAYGVNKANEWGADLFVSFHFNKAYDSYNGALGSEVCVYSTHEIAQRVVNALGYLGFKNRGQKVRTNLYELKHTNMKAMIVETCFIEATEDVELYKKLGPDSIGKAIAEAIANGKSAENTTTVKNEEIIKPVQTPTSNTDDWVARLQAECNKQGFSNQKVDNYPGPNTLAGCPTLKKGTKGKITKLAQEKLISLGYDLGIYGADEVFGTATYNAVVKFQKDNGLTTDGIIGQNTWRKLLNL